MVFDHVHTAYKFNKAGKNRFVCDAVDTFWHETQVITPAYNGEAAHHNYRQALDRVEKHPLFEAAPEHWRGAAMTEIARNLSVSLTMHAKREGITKS